MCATWEAGGRRKSRTSVLPPQVRLHAGDGTVLASRQASGRRVQRGPSHRATRSCPKPASAALTRENYACLVSCVPQSKLLSRY